MSTFEYVMVLVSIVIGLALTHVLTAIAAGVHRLRGHGTPLTLDPVYLLWVGNITIWLVSFWWVEYTFREAQEWTFGLYLFVISFAIVLFLLASILVPYRLEGVEDTYEYFIKGRTWFFGAYIIAVGFDVVDTLLKGPDYAAAAAAYWHTGVYLAVAVTGMTSSRRGVQLVAVCIASVFSLLFMFQQLGVLQAQ
jgi:hypothetical protein